MSIEVLLNRLDGVKELSGGKFVAKCPAHDDRSPSLAIKDSDDGKLLIHCFAGCSPQSVLDAIGMTFSDIMPERIGTGHYHKGNPNWIQAKDALAALAHESFVVSIIGADFLEHKEIDAATWRRLADAVQRINSARALCAPAKL